MKCELNTSKTIKLTRDWISRVRTRAIEPLDLNVNQLIINTSNLNATIPLIQTMSRSLSDMDDCLQNLKLSVPTDVMKTTQSLSDELTLPNTFPAMSTPTVTTPPPSLPQNQFLSDPRWRFIIDNSKLIWKENWPITTLRMNQSLHVRQSNRSNNKGKAVTNFRSQQDTDRTIV